jgi:hypothetical protein
MGSAARSFARPANSFAWMNWGSAVENVHVHRDDGRTAKHRCQSTNRDELDLVMGQDPKDLHEIIAGHG